jgi:hypothetical protein
LKVYFLIFSLNVTFFEKSFNCDEIWRKISAIAKSPTYLRSWLIRKNLTQKQAFAYFHKSFLVILSAKNFVFMPVYLTQALRKFMCAQDRMQQRWTVLQRVGSA